MAAVTLIAKWLVVSIARNDSRLGLVTKIQTFFGIFRASRDF